METHIRIITGTNDGWGLGISYFHDGLSLDFFRWYIIFVWHKS